MIYLFLFLFTTLFACTDFIVETEDGNYINGRSLEFAMELDSQIQLFPRNQKVFSKSPGKNGGAQWVSKYGFLGITALGMDFAFDGLNEEGLSFGYLWLPEITKYPDTKMKTEKPWLDFVDLCAWILGNFSNISEVKKALQTVQIWGHEVPHLGVPPVHAAIHDAEGNNLVIEFINGAMKIYDNPISVLTNAPAFEWHLTNLQNYLHLDAKNVENARFRNSEIHTPGEGSGFIGIPGDWTPPSRFVKMVTYLRFAQMPANSNEGVNLTEHLLNTVDIPLGEVRNEKGEFDYTQWVAIKDLNQKVFYFRSYKNLALKKIELKKLDFSKEKKQIPIDKENTCSDVTKSLL